MVKKVKQKSSKESLGTLLALLTAIISGVAIIANKIFIVDMEPMVFTAVRALIIGIVFFVIIWIRATLPRMRVDQLMSFAWKGLFPMAVINLFVIAIEVLWLPENLIWVMIIINFGLAGVLILLWSRLFTLGGGRVEV